jgi:hypothetical protein
MKGNVPAQKAFATGVTHLLLFSGIMGIPLVQTIEELFKTATGVNMPEAFRRGFIHSANSLFDLEEKSGASMPTL